MKYFQSVLHKWFLRIIYTGIVYDPSQDVLLRVEDGEEGTVYFQFNASVQSNLILWLRTKIKLSFKICLTIQLMQKQLLP